MNREPISNDAHFDMSTPKDGKTCPEPSPSPRPPGARRRGRLNRLHGTGNLPGLIVYSAPRSAAARTGPEGVVASEGRAVGSLSGILLDNTQVITQLSGAILAAPLGCFRLRGTLRIKFTFRESRPYASS